MNKSEKEKDSQILYITGYGNDDNETVVYALNMPVNVRAEIEEDGTLNVAFYEYTPDKSNFVCQTHVVPDAAPPTRLADLVRDKSLDEALARTVGGWIAVYMRDGVFCTDACAMTFMQSFDLRDIAERLEKNMNDVYNKYRDEYK